MFLLIFLTLQKRTKRRYYVLHHHSSEWKTRLDCYENLKKFKASEQPRSTIYLSDVFRVVASLSDYSPQATSTKSNKSGSSSPASSAKSSKSTTSQLSFTLFTNSEKLVLAADTEKEKTLWTNVIQFNKNQEDNSSSTSTSANKEQQILLQNQGIKSSSQRFTNLSSKELERATIYLEDKNLDRNDNKRHRYTYFLVLVWFLFKFLFLTVACGHITGTENCSTFTLTQLVTQLN